MPLPKGSKFNRFNVAAYMKERRLSSETEAKQNKNLAARKQRLTRLEQKVGLIV